MKIARRIYVAFAWLFAVGILAQVFLVGLSLLGGRPSWDDHIGLGHSLGGFALLLILLAYLGRFPRSMKRLTWLNFAIYFLIADVVIFMRDSAPTIAALHPVLAVVLFSVTGTLAVRSWMIVRAPQTESAGQNKPVRSSATGNQGLIESE